MCRQYGSYLCWGCKWTWTYSPRIAELEALGRDGIGGLASQEAREPPVSVHHYAYVVRPHLGYAAVHSARAEWRVHVLCLSHASTECRGRLPPFCMCRTLDSSAPVNPNIYTFLQLAREAPGRGEMHTPS